LKVLYFFLPRVLRRSDMGYIVESQDSLLALFWKFRNQKSLLAKDKFWAVNSICTELGIWSRFGKGEVYDTPAGLTFFLMALGILKRSKALLILSAAQSKGSNIEGMPSWAPDWTVDENDRPSKSLAS
jgi:hypothetical protein